MGHTGRDAKRPRGPTRPIRCSGSLSPPPRPERRNKPVSAGPLGRLLPSPGGSRRIAAGSRMGHTGRDAERPRGPTRPIRCSGSLLPPPRPERRNKPVPAGPLGRLLPSSGGSRRIAAGSRMGHTGRDAERPRGPTRPIRCSGSLLPPPRPERRNKPVPAGPLGRLLPSSGGSRRIAAGSRMGHTGRDAERPRGPTRPIRCSGSLLPPPRPERRNKPVPARLLGRLMPSWRRVSPVPLFFRRNLSEI